MDFPQWFLTLKSLTTLYVFHSSLLSLCFQDLSPVKQLALVFQYRKMERTQLQGQVPASLFSLANLQTV